MLFNSWSFALFFPLVTVGYFISPQRFRWAWLLLASCIFYMAFVPAYILILAFTIAVDFVAGLLIDRAHGDARRNLLFASLAANLGVLTFFKYFDFANANVAALAGFLHWHYPIQALSILLPIGLSFHVFQSLSYTIEVYRGKQEPERHLGIFALYVMFYPQLVAGPIERPQNLLHQLHSPPDFNDHLVRSGLRRMLWGLFKKVVIADRLAVLVNPVFDHPQGVQGLPLLVAVVLFSFQIYCDFSGYSDIAIGAARVMGIDLMENFRTPYYARSLGDFWRRWHISLSTWFRDYVYLPLGGGQGSSLRSAFNLLVVFTLSGLWHGAQWTYVAWGVLHGLTLATSRLTRGIQAIWADRLQAWFRLPPLVVDGACVLRTFGLVTLFWVFFRARSFEDAYYILTHLSRGLAGQFASHDALRAALFGFASRTQFSIAFLAIALMEIVQILHQRGTLSTWFAGRSRSSRWLAYYGLVMTIILFGVFDNHAFIYFQF